LNRRDRLPLTGINLLGRTGLTGDPDTAVGSHRPAGVVAPAERCHGAGVTGRIFAGIEEAIHTLESGGHPILLEVLIPAGIRIACQLGAAVVLDTIAVLIDPIAEFHLSGVDQGGMDPSLIGIGVIAVASGTTGGIFPVVLSAGGADESIGVIIAVINGPITIVVHSVTELDPTSGHHTTARSTTSIIPTTGAAASFGGVGGGSAIWVGGVIHLPVEVIVDSIIAVWGAGITVIGRDSTTAIGILGDTQVNVGSASGGATTAVNAVVQLVGTVNISIPNATGLNGLVGGFGATSGGFIPTVVAVLNHMGLGGPTVGHPLSAVGGTLTAVAATQESQENGKQHESLRVEIIGTREERRENTHDLIQEKRKEADRLSKPSPLTGMKLVQSINPKSQSMNRFLLGR